MVNYVKKRNRQMTAKDTNSISQQPNKPKTRAR